MQNKKGFTLVELIVVITILAILGTIAFISLQGFSGDSRDSKRISDLSQIRTGLQVYQAKEGIVPMPNNHISIGSGTTTYIYQGYAGTGTLNTLRVSEAKDPIDNKYYTYATNTNQTKYQLTTLLENGDELGINNKLLNQTYANYENRTPYTIGYQLGTLLEGTTKRPVQELGENINLQTDIAQYIPLLDREDNSTSFSGSELVTKIEETTNNNGETVIVEEELNLRSWNSVDSNCELDDIPFDTNGDGEYDQIWAGCNSTLGDGIEWGEGSSGNGTISSCYPDYDGVNLSSDNSCQISSSEMSSNYNPKNWFVGSNGNGDSEFDTIWGKLYAWDNSSSACPEGWKVPSDQDWTKLENTFSNTDIGWMNHNSKNEENNIVNALKIPLSGFRSTNSSSFGGRGLSTHLWTSTKEVSTDNSFRRSFVWDNNAIGRNARSTIYGFSVRCIKDI